jgi:hypothetical protein
MAESAPTVMANHNLEKLERALKWERAAINKKVNNLLLEKAEIITETLIDIGLSERNPNVLNSLLDRAFGKAAQAVVHEGNPDKPIVFMPAVLMEKYQIQQAEYTHIDDEKEIT